MSADRERIIADLLTILVVILFLVLLRIKSWNDTVITFSSPNQYYDIYMITIDKMDQHWYLMDQGASDMARMLGVGYQWMAPESKDTQRQKELLAEAVQRGAEAVLIAVNDPVALSGAIEDAKAQGVRIIYVDTPAYEEAVITLSTDNHSAGLQAGRAMLYELAELGIESGRIGIIGVNEVTDSTLRREEGFREAIKADGKFTLVPTEYSNGDPDASREASMALMRNYPDLVGLFGTNEGSTIGVGNAIKEIKAQNQRRNIIGVGFDQSEQLMALLKDGSLSALVIQNPYTMGYLGVAEAVASLRGFDTGPEIINTGVTVLRGALFQN